MDVDGVICNFVGGLIKSHQWDIEHDDWKSYYHNRQMGVEDAVMWDPTLKPGWWLSLEPYPGAKEFIQAIRDAGHDIIYSSAPSVDSKCAAEKIDWLRQHGFMNGNDYTLGPKKFLLAGSGGILIDDSDDQISAFQDRGGVGVLFPQPWNKRWSQLVGGTSLEYRYKITLELLLRHVPLILKTLNREPVANT